LVHLLHFDSTIIVVWIKNKLFGNCKREQYNEAKLEVNCFNKLIIMYKEDMSRHTIAQR